MDLKLHLKIISSKYQVNAVNFKNAVFSLYFELISTLFKGSASFTQISKNIISSNNNSTPFDFTRENPKKILSHGSNVCECKKHKTICYSHVSNRKKKHILKVG